MFVDPVAMWFRPLAGGPCLKLRKHSRPTPGSNRLMFNIHTDRGLTLPSWRRARNALLSSINIAHLAEGEERPWAAINIALLAEGERLKLSASLRRFTSEATSPNF